MTQTVPQAVHWNITAPHAPTCHPMAGDIAVDVAIIGAGLTGLRAAIGLAEAGTQVAVLDAHQIGFGASGRSGGQCNPMWRATPKKLSEMLGKVQADRLIETTLGAADALFDDIKRYKIRCEAEQNGWIQASHSKKSARDLRDLSTAWRAEGAPIDDLSGTDLAKLSGSNAYDFGLLHAKGGSVQPLALTRGFAATAQSLGAQLFENSPATSLSRHSGKWHVQTPGGRVEAETVILTTNGYTDALWPGLKQTILPLVSVIMATEPLGEAQRATVLPARTTLSDTRRAICYTRFDAENRLIFGRVGSNEQVEMLGGHTRMRDGLADVFPQIADIEISCAWGGRIAVTQDHLPHLHQPAPGILAGLGFNGRGIVMSSVMGRTLARKALGGANSDLPFAVSPISPAPLNWAKRQVIPLVAPVLSLQDRVEEIIETRKL